MNGLELRQAFTARTRIYGTLILAPSPHWSEAIQSANLDFVFIDMEHIALERTDVAWMCQMYQGVNVAPVVRIPAPDPYQANMAIDGGACAVIAPYIETVEQVQQLVGAVKYRPLKGRKLYKILDGTSQPEKPLKQYLNNRNQDKSVIINIESVAAIETLDDLLEVPGLDAILVGPHDLSCNLGIPEDYSNPLFLDAIKQIIQKGCEHNKSVGIHVFSSMAEYEIDWIRLGMNFVIHSADILLFNKALKSELDAIRSAVGDQQESRQDNEINI